MNTFNFGLGVLISTAICLHGWKSKSLKKSGAVSAFCIGSFLFTINPAYGWLLIVFYILGSRVSKIRHDIKMKQEENIKSQRDYLQVVACSLPLLVCLSFKDIRVSCTIALASMGCSLGDTFASEIGSVYSSTPILITTLKSVPPGSNGAISSTGTIASWLGGCCIGLCYQILCYIYPTHLVPLSTFWKTIFLLGGGSGLVGSMIDSLLGALFQESRYNETSKKITSDKSAKHISGLPLLSNEAVNLISALLTGMIFAHFLAS
jgi:uncharacterized protein (TIGR00297 family)